MLDCWNAGDGHCRHRHRRRHCLIEATSASWRRRTSDPHSHRLEGSKNGDFHERSCFSLDVLVDFALWKTLMFHGVSLAP